MTTTRPRIQVLVDQEMADALKDLSRSGGVSVSSFVAGLLGEMKPQILSMAQAFKLAKTSRIEAFDLMSKALADAQHEAAQLSLDVASRKRQALRRLSPEVQDRTAARKKPAPPPGGSKRPRKAKGVRG